LRTSLANISIGLLFLLLSSCFNKTANTERLVRDFIKEQEEKVKPYQTQLNDSYWKMAKHADDDDSLLNYCSHLLKQHGVFMELQSGIAPLFNDFSDYQFLKKVRESGVVKDELLRRQMDVLWRLFQSSGQGHDSIENQRASLVKRLTDLNKSKSQGWRYNDSIFEGYQVGIQELHSELNELVKLVNEYAQGTGYDNYFSYLIDDSEMDMGYRNNLIHLIDSATRKDYLTIKKEAERILCDSLKLPKNQLGFRHYNFFFRECKWPENWSNIRTRNGIKTYCDEVFKLYGFGVNKYIEGAIINSNARGDACRSIVLNCDNYYDIRCCCNAPLDDKGLVTFLKHIGQLTSYSQVEENIPYFLRQPSPIVKRGLEVFWGNLPMVSHHVQEEMKLDHPTHRFDFSVDNPWFLFRLRYLLVIAEMEKEILNHPEQDLTMFYWNLISQYMLINVPDKLQHAEWVSEPNLLLLDGSAQHELLSYVWAAHVYHEIRTDQNARVNFENSFLVSGNRFPWYIQIKGLSGKALNPAFLKCLYMEEG